MENNQNKTLQKTDDTLTENELRFKALFENSKDALMTIEPPSWKFSLGNPATLEMFMAKDEKEFSSVEPWKLSPERQEDGSFSIDKAKKMINIALRDGSIFFEWTHQRLNGEIFPATVLLTRISWGGKTFIQATVRDITKQKEQEKELNEKILELEKFNKMMVDREIKMTELKKEIEELKEKKA
jgi:PAS domain S-box-containing protein